MDFFQNHGIITLIFLTFFPRITLLFGSFITGGIFWWIGWLIAPHILVAILSLKYWDRNPILVIVACVIAIYGTDWEAQNSKKLKKYTTPTI